MVNNADNVILVNKNPDKEKLRVQDKLTPDIDASTHDAEVTVEKQRETGWTGMFKLKFDKLRGTYRAW
jgi:twinkle protein